MGHGDAGVLDTGRRSAHDRDVESPSLIESIIGFPGAVLRLPSTALAAMEAVNDMAERLDRLMTLLERLDGGVDQGRLGDRPRRAGHLGRGLGTRTGGRHTRFVAALAL